MGKHIVLMLTVSDDSELHVSLAIMVTLYVPAVHVAVCALPELEHVPPRVGRNAAAIFWLVPVAAASMMTLVVFGYGFKSLRPAAGPAGPAPKNVLAGGI